MHLNIHPALLTIIALLSIAEPSFATDGYFSAGFGVKQQGQGGAGIALPADSLVGAANPAGLIFVGDPLDFGLTLFRPFRDSSITGNQLPPGYPDVSGRYDANRVKSAGSIGVTVLLILYPRLPTGKLVGSDIARAVPLTLVAGLGHWFLGSIDVGLLLSLLMGSIPGVIIGSYISARIPDRVLRPVLASTLAVVGARLSF